jgi:hypothetical protein
MRVAYITLDDVNRFTMQSWAQEGSVQVHCPIPSEIHAVGEGMDGIGLNFVTGPGEIIPATKWRCV